MEMVKGSLLLLVFFLKQVVIWVNGSGLPKRTRPGVLSNSNPDPVHPTPRRWKRLHLPSSERVGGELGEVCTGDAWNLLSEATGKVQSSRRGSHIGAGPFLIHCIPHARMDRHARIATCPHHHHLLSHFGSRVGYCCGNFLRLGGVLRATLHNPGLPIWLVKRLVCFSRCFVAFDQLSSWPCRVVEDVCCRRLHPLRIELAMPLGDGSVFAPLLAQSVAWANTSQLTFQDNGMKFVFSVLLNTPRLYFTTLPILTRDSEPGAGCCFSGMMLRDATAVRCRAWTVSRLFLSAAGGVWCALVQESSCSSHLLGFTLKKARRKMKAQVGPPIEEVAFFPRSEAPQVSSRLTGVACAAAFMGILLDLIEPAAAAFPGVSLLFFPVTCVHVISAVLEDLEVVAAWSWVGRLGTLVPSAAAFVRAFDGVKASGGVLSALLNKYDHVLSVPVVVVT